jgi:hypothetical protein
LQVGLVQFDIWIPANPNDGDNAFGFQFTHHSLYVIAGSSGNVLQLFMDWGTATSVPVLASTWYTAKFWVDVTGQPWRGKLWERGTPEPDWQASGVVAASSVHATPYLDWYYSPAAEPGQIDNIFLWSAMPWTFYSVFTLDAQIHSTGGVFTLDAQIYLMGGAFTLDAMVASSVTDAPVWIDTTTAMQFSSNGITVPESSQFADGDIEILRISMDALGAFSWGWSTAWVGNPWQLLGFDELSDGNQILLTFWRRYSPGSTSVSLWFTMNGLTYQGSIVAVLSGYRNVLAIETSVLTQSTLDTLTHTSESITTDLQNTLVEVAWSEPVGHGTAVPYWVNLTPGWTPLPLADTTYAALLVAYRLFPYPGSYGPVSVDYLGYFGSLNQTQIRTVYLFGYKVTPGVRLQACVGATTQDLFLLFADIEYGLTLDAQIAPPMRTSITLDACIRPPYQTFTLDTWISAPPTRAWSVTLDALIYQRGFTLDARIALVTPWAQSGSRSLDAVVLGIGLRGYVDLDAVIDAWHRSGAFSLDAFVVGTLGSCTLDAQIAVPSVGSGAWTLDAFISQTFRSASVVLGACVQSTSDDLVQLDAFIGSTMIRGCTLDAVIPVYLTLDAFLIGTVNRTFTLDAQVPCHCTLDAVIVATRGGPPVGGVALPLQFPPVQIGTQPYNILLPFVLADSGQTISIEIDALSGIPGTYSGLELVTPDGNGAVWSGISLTPLPQKWSYQLQTSPAQPLQLAFALTPGTFYPALTGSGTIMVSAITPAPLVFTLDAIIIGAGFTAAIGTSTLDACVLTHPTGACTLDAYVRNTGWPRFCTLDAEIRYPAHVTLVAIVSRISIESFSLDAIVAPSFTLSAWVGNAPAVGAQGAFSLDAFIWRPPWTPTPSIVVGPTPPPLHTVKITVAGEDLTANVVWALTSFTQVARTGPGNFTVVLRGISGENWDGGEDVQLYIDGFLVFGGFVMQIERGYFFPDYPDARLALHGTDYNILLDKLVLWNKPNNPLHEGAYIPIPDFPKGTSDQALLRKALKDWVQLPPGFTADKGIDEISSPNPDTNGATANGITLREFLQGISTMTQGVFWWDAYKSFQYHPRDVVSALFSITDNFTGAEGTVGCRDLVLTTDITNMVTDDIVWGVMAQTVAGEVIYDHADDPAGVDTYGFWQWAEYRSDIRTKTHVQTRAQVALDRYSIPVPMATCTIFEPGLGAGQVVTLQTTAYGRSDDLVIRQMTIRFTGQTPSGGVMGGIPQFDLVMGLDPEAPWQIYDALPFDQVSAIDIPQFSFEIPRVHFWQGGLPTLWKCEDCTIVLIESFLDKADGDPWGTPDYMPTGQTWSGAGTAQGQRGYLDGSESILIDLTPPPACIFGMFEWGTSTSSLTLQFGNNGGSGISDYVQIDAQGNVGLQLTGPFGGIAQTLYTTIDSRLTDNGPFLVRAYIDQQSLSLRVWPSAIPEPTEWTVTLNASTGIARYGQTLTIVGSALYVDFVGLSLCPGEIVDTSPAFANDGLALYWDNEWTYWNEFDPSGHLIYYAIPGSFKSFNQTIGPLPPDQIVLSASARGSYWWNNAPIWGNTQHKPWPYEPFSFVSRQVPYMVPKGVASVEGWASVQIVRQNVAYVAPTTVWPIGALIGRGTYNQNKDAALGLREQWGGECVVDVTA